MVAVGVVRGMSLDKVGNIFLLFVLWQSVWLELEQS